MSEGSLPQPGRRDRPRKARPAGQSERRRGAEPAEAPIAPDRNAPDQALPVRERWRLALTRVLRWRLAGGRHPLASRIVLLSLLLLGLVQAAGFSVIQQSIELNAQRQLRDRLNLATRVWDRLLDQRASKLSQGAAVLASDYGFREAMSSNDLPTLRSVLDNHGSRIGATLAALLDQQFNVQALSEGADAAWGPALARVAPQLAQRQGSGQVVMVAGRPYQFVLAPIKAPVVLGWVVMGFPLESSLVNDMAELSGLHATLVVQAPLADPKVLASSLRPLALAEPLTRLVADQPVELAGETHLVASARVAGHHEAGQPSEGSVRLALAGTMAAAKAPYRSLQWLLSAIALLGVLAFGVGSHWMARYITQPLRRLARASERLGRGDYDQPLQTTGRGDEIDDLAAAFDHMRVNIAAQQQQIRDLAYRDRLTGLPNRLAFRDEVAQAVAHGQKRNRPLAVLVVDIDRFKQVNDVLGFAFGDRVLVAVGVRLQQAVRQEDVVARIGGNAFALLLRHADSRMAEQLAHRISLSFEQPIQLDDQTVDLGAGVGIACWPQHATDVDALISRAELAMYTAKRRTSGAQMYDSSVETSSAQNLSLLTELRRAVERNELQLYLQPKVHLPTGEARAAEALVRWQPPTRGLVPPMQFIPFAEQTGFIRHLTIWMLGEVARLQGSLAGLGVERISVNLSTRDLMDNELCAKLDALMRQHGARPEGFCLEITESAIMDDPNKAEATLNRLANRGLKLSIDDFGTGYSSLAYLKRLPVNELKIDKSFVMAMERNEGDATIVRSTIDLAHNLGLQVVAEGVENQAIMDLLGRLHCDEAQGYHLAKPLPVPQFVDWVSRWRARPVAGATGREGRDTRAAARDTVSAQLH